MPCHLLPLFIPCHLRCIALIHAIRCSIGYLLYGFPSLLCYYIQGSSATIGSSGVSSDAPSASTLEEGRQRETLRILKTSAPGPWYIEARLKLTGKNIYFMRRIFPMDFNM